MEKAGLSGCGFLKAACPQWDQEAEVGGGGAAVPRELIIFINSPIYQPGSEPSLTASCSVRVKHGHQRHHTSWVCVCVCVRAVPPQALLAVEMELVLWTGMNAGCRSNRSLFRLGTLGGRGGRDGTDEGLPAQMRGGRGGER